MMDDCIVDIKEAKIQRISYCKYCGTQVIGGTRGTIRKYCNDCTSKWVGKNRWHILQALTRANQKCERCGDAPPMLHVHHIDSTGGTQKPNHTLSNLKVLCPLCHVREHKESGTIYGHPSKSP